MQDHEVIERVKKGKADLFEILVRRYEGKLFALAWRMLHNRADADDAVQEAFVKAYRSLKRFRGEARFSTWLYRIALNHILNRLRRGSRMREADLDLERMPSILTPSYATRQKELEVAVARATDQLPPRQRAIFHMRYEEEHSHAEIAEILGISEGAVKASYHHAVTKLRKSLKGFVPQGDKK
ncbi:RNA polymerase subunit sigma-70 [candidate division TA06 bacterium B3_TA06]|uniref:RNA polymerase subunit sigma-70 n=1 Tax=candidate division TA06 bacterium B3_TA06 TaxID=2012487 RepID=A0A532V9S3_UNCT6|nr:MAG: RNA polymerase subunit sigma-70 [candidate division TA06 bacterium B3_TA06]